MSEESARRDLSLDLVVLLIVASALDLFLTALALPAAVSSPEGVAVLALDVARYWALLGIPLALAVALLRLALNHSPFGVPRALSPPLITGVVLGTTFAALLLPALQHVPDRSNIEFPAALHVYDAVCVAVVFGLAYLIVHFFHRRAAQLEATLPLLFSRRLFLWLVPLVALTSGVILAHLVAAPIYHHHLAILFCGTSLTLALLVRSGAKRQASRNWRRWTLAGLLLLVCSLPLSGNRFSRFVLHGHLAGAGAIATYFRDLTDFDSDGASATYLGGNDCAPFNSEVSPLHKEVPGDGIDQDCSGGDAPMEMAVPRPQLLSACASRQPLDILLISIDALRPELVNGWVMPNLQRLKARGHSYSRAYPPSGSTAGTVHGMLTGKSLSDLNTHSLYLNEPLRLGKSITMQLKESGYRTAVLFSFELSPFFTLGADLATLPFADVVPGAVKGVHRVGAMSRTALDFFLTPRAQGTQPAFLWMHIPDMHAPYRVLDETSTLSAYEQAASSVDQQLGALFSVLDGAGRLDRTLVVVTSDHGEQLGQRGREGHGTLFFEEGIRVPLLLLAPGCGTGTHLTPVNLTALPDLLLRYAGQRKAVPEAEPSTFPVVVEEALLSSLGLKRAFIGPRYKLLLDLRNGGAVAFDLRDDPRETSPLPFDSARLQPLKAQYQRWLDAPGQR